MVRMDEIHAAIHAMSSRPPRVDEHKAGGPGNEPLERSGDGTRELVLAWFVETQASLILHDGCFPAWFRGFISRQEAEDQLRDKPTGSFIIRLSEKASGYILSYKGKDRCRHFVINQTNDSMLVVCGDCLTHTSLPELIEHFTHTPIQPFGECLILDRESEVPSDNLYDVVHATSHVKSGVSVQALRSLWDQRAEVTTRGPPQPAKSSNHRVTSFSSIDRNKIAQVVSPVLKKNLPLRNSWSTNLTGRRFHGTEPHRKSEEWPCRMGTDEGLHLRIRAWETGGFSSLDTHLPCYSESQQTDRHQCSQRRSLPDLEEHQTQGSHPAKPSPPASPHAPLAPPRSVFCSSSALFKEENQSGPNNLLHTTLTILHPNPLYQTSSGLSAGHNNHWDTHTHHEPGQSSEISSKPISVPVTLDNTYQDLSENQNSNTYEDIPATHSNTYATVEELQPRQNTWGKKTHKWWKFLPESKKK